MADTNPEIEELIRRALESRLAEAFFCLPAIVKSYDPAKQSADLIPAVKRTLPSDETGEQVAEELPVLPNVRVAWPRVSNFRMHFHLTPGDSVLVLFSDRGIAEWRTTGKVSTPGDTRVHGIGSPVCLPGWYPDTDLMASTEGIGHPDGPHVRFTPAHVGVGDASDFVALAGLVLSELNDIRSKFDTHTHLYNPGPGAALATIVPATPMGPAGDVASGNLKAD